MADLVNGIFEFIGAILCWLNVKRIRKERELKGFYWPVQAFFTVWGVWNLFYYPHLEQWFSFTGGALLVLGNGTWVGLAIKYSLAERRQI